MRSREVPIAKQIAHCTLMWELTANNFYQHNCVGLKPVSIIWFIYQFGFQIVWDSDPSGFGILKWVHDNWPQQTDREQRRLAEKGHPKYIFTIPRAILPKPSLSDEITVTKSLLAVSVSQSVDLARSEMPTPSLHYILWQLLVSLPFTLKPAIAYAITSLWF